MKAGQMNGGNMKRAAFACVVVVAAASAACGTKTVTDHASAEDHGRELFSDHAASPSASNPFSCANCHPSAGTTGRIFSGGMLAGVTTRTSFWGGAENDLLRSINDCRASFMDAPAPWTTDDDDANAMYAYLQSLAGPADPIAFTLVEPPVADVMPGDANAGAITFGAACKQCHGELHSGNGRIASFVPALPDEVIAQHASLNLTPVALRGVFVQKIRRGGADTPGQSMPPFSKETLADEDVAGLVALFGL
jgi:thiosulfate dehydrogenase